MFTRIPGLALTRARDDQWFGCALSICVQSWSSEQRPLKLEVVSRVSDAAKLHNEVPDSTKDFTTFPAYTDRSMGYFKWILLVLRRVSYS